MDILPLALSLLLQAPTAPAPQKLEASSLKTVPGPLVPEGMSTSLGPGVSDISRQLRRSARQAGTVPAVALPEGPLLIEDKMDNQPAGWKAYRAEVGPNGTVHIRLKAVRESWFKVYCVNRWGQIEAGMLQNKIPTGNPEASFKNPKAEPATVWFIVDILDADTRNEPYTLQVTPGIKP